MPDNLTDAEETRLLALSAVNGDKLALVTALGSDSAAGTEVTGGSYARQALAYTGSNPRTNSGSVQFPGMPAADVQGWEVWSSDGSARKWSGVLDEFTATAAASSDVLTSTGHGLVNDDEVILYAAASGLARATVYHVIAATTNTFQVSATTGGAAVDLTTDGPVVLGRVVSAAAGTAVNVAVGAVSLALS